MTTAHRKSLILPGAGARGAYQVGVLKAVAELLPKRAGNPFSILSGTSAGAINAAVLASRAIHFQQAVADMERVWANFSTDQVFRSDIRTMLLASTRWLRALILGGGSRNPQSFLDCEPLRELLRHEIPFGRIDKVLASGHLDVLAVTASAYTSARSVTFFQSSAPVLPWARVRRIGRPTKITLDHVMASSAVPFVFPPVRIGSEYYGDGSMRNRTPLSSAIHLGADRVLVIGVRDEHPDPEPVASTEPSPPSFAEMAGYMLDTLFMDGLYSDLERLTRMNLLLDQIQSVRLKPPIGRLRHIHTLIILPSEDIRSIAARHVREMPKPVRILLNRMGAARDGGRGGGMQLISYLLFESGFTRELIAMGYRDARAREEEIRAFLFDDQIGTIDAPLFLPAD